MWQDHNYKKCWCFKLKCGIALSCWIHCNHIPKFSWPPWSQNQAHSPPITGGDTVVGAHPDKYLIILIYWASLWPRVSAQECQLWRDLPDTNCLLSCWRCPWSSSCLKNSKVTRDVHLPKLYETYIQIIQHFIDLKHPDITECSLQLGKLVFWNHPMSALHLLWGRVRSLLHRPCAFIWVYSKAVSGRHHPSGNVARKASRWRWRSASKHRMEWSSRWRAERSSY